MEALLYYLLLGIVAGTLAGMLGIGGGLIIVPALVIIFKAQGFDPSIIMHLALGTSLATIVVTSLSSIRTHHQRGAVQWPVVIRLSAGIMVGALCGALLAGQFASDWLQKLFAIFALLVALQMALELRPEVVRDLPGCAALAGVGGVIGVVSALVGIGGGSMTTPFLLWCGVAVRQAIATSAACGLPIALAGALGYWLAGQSVAGLPEWSSGYLYWPALVGVVASSIVCASFGARMTHLLSVRVLKRGFALLLFVIGCYLIIS
ncbi:MAG: sulfite exporter TauE/SafE family protein [Gammaproteobacteria bacterium]|nr:sulfite exporter TauE/SafE family protein [Gammaproteobacteria bacterium]